MNNNSKAAAKRTQIVYSEPQRLLVSSRVITDKHGKEQKINKYRNNPNAIPVKTIIHPLVSKAKV